MKFPMSSYEIEQAESRITNLKDIQHYLRLAFNVTPKCLDKTEKDSYFDDIMCQIKDTLAMVVDDITCEKDKLRENIELYEEV